MIKRANSSFFTKLGRVCLVGMAFLMLSGCGDRLDNVASLFSDAGSEPPLEGERHSLFHYETRLSKDPRLAKEEILLPEAVKNASWPQNGRSVSNVIEHLVGPETYSSKPYWSERIGFGTGHSLRLMASPIAAENKIFTMDSEGLIRAIDAKNARTSWVRSTLPKHEHKFSVQGGGLAYANGKVFATSSFGQVYALDSKSGDTLWKQDIGQSIRMMPTVSDGYLVVASALNNLFVFDEATGETVWTYEGALLSENSIATASTPAISQGRLVSVFSNGTVVSFDLKTGRVLWESSVFSKYQIYDVLNQINDIVASPVIDNGVVYITTFSGNTRTIDLETGEKIWDLELNGTQTPLVVGDYVFIISRNAELFCISRKNGQVYWVTQLRQYAKERQRYDPITWVGPLLVNGQLLVTSSKGELLTFSPYDGMMTSRQFFHSGTTLSPIVVDGWLYILTSSGKLITFN